MSQGGSHTPTWRRCSRVFTKHVPCQVLHWAGICGSITCQSAWDTYPLFLWEKLYGTSMHSNMDWNRWILRLKFISLASLLVLAHAKNILPPRGSSSIVMSQ